ncbi:hypothetical protein [Streptomyces lycii]|uniref:Uncharacterized protein n=1 Tax=Streptomyces lycii TaxID=2654337 RepID=A0ABQ7FJ59_9ACTN|nr:hypothetical protein [Streptomyces lycii]KAF4408663.1 hypothetical protein GCU69_13280 [Streptomyces lycii]
MEPLSVYDATAAELDLLAVESVSPGQCASALALARAIDSTGNATALSNAARELRMIMETLRAVAPVRAHNDRLDELNQRRAERRKRDQSA